jgi:hypothetical protein
MNDQASELDRHIVKVMAQITAAAANSDVPSIQRLSRKAAELQDMRDQMTALQQRIANLSTEAPTPSASATRPNGKLRELAVEVTDGDIRQNLLKLTPHIRRGKIRVGEELIIETLPSGERFQTQVSDKGNKLRARGEVARFYREARVKAADYVLLTEIAPGRWTLKKAPSGEYGVPYLTE